MADTRKNTRVKLMLAAIVLSPAMKLPMSVMKIEPITARTTLRLWHDLHVEKKIAHDFQDLFAPQTDDHTIFMGAIINDEIKAIAQCKQCDNGLVMRRIAHAPHYEIAGDAMVQFLASDQVALEETIRISQPRWFIAYSYYKTVT